MADIFDICLAFTLRQDGGYVDDPADPGGATNMGIILATYREWSEDSHGVELNPELAGELIVVLLGGCRPGCSAGPLCRRRRFLE